MKPIFSTLACAVLTFAGCAGQAPTPAQASALAYWRFDGAGNGARLGAGAGVADVAGGGNALLAADVFAQPLASADKPYSPVVQGNKTNGIAAQFRGNDDLYTQNSALGTFDFSPSGSNAWTVEFSVQLESFMGISRILGRDGNTPGADTRGPLQIVATDGNGDDSWELRLEILDGQNRFQDVVKSGLQARRWYNVAATASSDTLKLWVDALDGNGYQLAGSKTIAGALNATKGNFALGRGWNNIPNDWMFGKLDEVRVSDTALLPSQFLFAPLSGGVQATPVPTPAPANVPLFIGADPHASVVGSTYWMYPTGEPIGDNNWVFFAYSSPDRKNWTKSAPILRFQDIPWIYADGNPRHYPWAPALASRNGKYFFYYSVGDQSSTPSRIGVASANSPAGPFVDSGRALVTGGNGFEAIDPMVFTDPKDRKPYLYAGGSNGAKLRIWELNTDMVSIKREIPVATPKKFTEGPFVHFRSGLYFLTYSFGGWHSPSYSVHYSTSTTPVGPWRYHGPILVSDATRKGPGHHSIIKDPTNSNYFLVHHRWQSATAGGDPFGSGGRSIAIAPLIHDAKNELNPIKMSDDVPVLQ